MELKEREEPPVALPEATEEKDTSDLGELSDFEFGTVGSGECMVNLTLHGGYLKWNRG